MKNERLDKVLAGAGSASRREVKQMIAAGRVTVNGETVRNPAAKVCRESDSIVADGVTVTGARYRYLLLNKPAGVVSATKDTSQPTVLGLVPPELFRKGLFPAGRLDKDATGMMILTDDGEFAHRILSPRRHIPKTYLVRLDIPVTGAMAESFNAGIALKGEKKCMPALLEPVDNHTARVTISEGMYHQIKRMFGCHGAKVLELRRIAMGGLAMDSSLPPGGCRELTPTELALLETGPAAR